MIWVDFLKEPLEVVCLWAHLTLVAARGGRDVPHVRVACLPIIAIVVAGRGRGPLKALLTPLFAMLATLLATVDGDVG
jgi:hypothetical protein